MPAPLIAAAGVAARGAVVGTRVVGQAAITGVRVAGRGASSAARGTEKGAEAAVKTSVSGIRMGSRATTQAAKTGYRFTRAVTKAVREEKSREEIEKHGYSTRANPKRFSRADPRRYSARAWNAAPIPGVAKRVALEMLPAGTKKQAARMGLITRVPGWVRRKNLANKARSIAGFQGKPIQPRISKTEGHAMIAVAVLFDLLPVLFIVGPIAGILLGVTGGQEDCKMWDAVCKVMNITEGVAGAAAMVGVLVVTPMLYALGSGISFVFGLLTFSVWFLFRGVNVFAFLFTTFFEVVPIINMLPLWSFGVWKTVRATRKEDTGWTDTQSQTQQRNAGDTYYANAQPAAA